MSRPRRVGVTDIGWRRMFRQEAWHRQRRRCKWCGWEMPIEDATADHLEPRFGTVAVSLDRSGNIVAAHRFCNNARGTLPEKQFQKILKGHLPAPSFDLRMVVLSRRLSDRADIAVRRILAMVGRKP